MLRVAAHFRSELSNSLVCWQPALIAQALPGCLDMLRPEGVALAGAPVMDSGDSNRSIEGSARILLRHPVDGGQQLHAVRCLEPLDQPADPVEALGRNRVALK